MTLTKNKPKKPEVQSQIMENERLILWCFMVASILGFGAFTSAYIVRMAQGNWTRFDVPDMFMYNCITVLAGSASMIAAYRAAKQDELDRVKYALWATFVLGVVFLVVQVLGFRELVRHEIFLSPKRSDNGDLSPLVSGSFFYVIAGVHFAHVVAGLIFLLIVIVKAHQWKVHKKNMLTISLASTFWHFVGILWIYLFLFLKFWN